MSDQPNVRGPKRPATYQDVIEAPEDKVAELIDGELVLSPRPAGLHTIFASQLGAELIGSFRHGRGGPGGWIILHEPELHLGKQILVPDLAGWRRERPTGLERDEPFTTVAPDWVCEVLSPSTEARDRIQKRRIYASAQVRHLWLADPATRLLEVFELRDGKWTLLTAHVGDEKVRAPPFDAVELELGPLWTP